MVVTKDAPQEYNNFKIPGTGCDLYGPQRLALAVHLRDDVLPFIKKSFFIENGTLLGAWRNGKFIPHDDDFDYGVLLDNNHDEKDSIKSILKIIQSKLRPCYECRLVSTYADKIEVYEPALGSYQLSPKYGGADYHYVTVDLQFYRTTADNKHEQMYYLGASPPVLESVVILPQGEIVLEEETFPAPNQTHEFLVANYGSLDPAAKYNSKTGKYHL